MFPGMNPSISNNAAVESVLAVQQSATKSSVAYAVAGKALDAQRSAGDAAIQLLEAASPGKAAGRAAGKGGLLDTAG